MKGHIMTREEKLAEIRRTDVYGLLDKRMHPKDNDPFAMEVKAVYEFYQKNGRLPGTDGYVPEKKLYFFLDGLRKRPGSRWYNQLILYDFETDDFVRALLNFMKDGSTAKTECFLISFMEDRL